MARVQSAPRPGVVARFIAMAQERTGNHAGIIASLCLIGFTGVVGIIVLGAMGRTIPESLAIIAGSAGGALGGALAVAPHTSAAVKRAQAHDQDEGEPTF